MRRTPTCSTYAPTSRASFSAPSLPYVLPYPHRIYIYRYIYSVLSKKLTVSAHLQYIILDPKLNATNNQTPFRCSDFKSRWPDLEGAFFEMVRDMPVLNDSYCVFAGRQCSFNDMITFVNSTASSTEMRPHQWIAGGVLFVLKNRILPGVIPSTSILEDYLHVVGPPPEQGDQSFKAAFHLVLKPFSPQAWGIISGVLLLFCAIRCIMIYMFGKVVGKLGFFRTLFLFNFQRDRRPRDSREEDWWNILDKHWGIALIIFLSILVLLYEVALAVIAFESAGTPELIGVSADKFAVYAGTTEEYFFERLVKNPEQASKFNTLDSLYNSLKNKSLLYTVSYRIDNRYEVTTNPDLCKHLRLYDEVPASLAKGRKPPPVSGTWFYSALIPADKRAAIDKGILELRALGQIHQFVDQAIGSDEASGRCASDNNQISGFMLLLLVSLPIFYLVALFLALGIACFKTKRRRKESLPEFGDNNPSILSKTSNSSSSASENLSKLKDATPPPGTYTGDASKKDRIPQYRRITLS